MANVKKPTMSNLLERFGKLTPEEQETIRRILSGESAQKVEPVKWTSPAPVNSIRRTGNVSSAKVAEGPKEGKGVYIVPETFADGRVKVQEGKSGYEDTVNYITVDSDGNPSKPVETLRAIIREAAENFSGKGYIKRHGWAPGQVFGGNHNFPNMPLQKGRNWAPVSVFCSIVEQAVKAGLKQPYVTVTD